MLTDEEAVRLIAVIAAYDARQPPVSNGEIRKWVLASHYAQPPWPSYLAVEEAVHRHYANATWPVMPGHITEMIAAAYAERRRQVGGHPSGRPYAELAVEAEARPEPSPEPSPARAAAIRAITERLGKAKGIPPA